MFWLSYPCRMRRRTSLFTADFWGNVYDNAVAAGQYGPDAAPLGGVGTQIFNCMIIMMWCFVGIEGASVVSSRAARKTDVGKATLIGFICLMLIYVGASVLPYGYMSSAEVAALDYPALVYVFSSMAPGWGGPFISIAIIISILGSWLSFTILPAETTSEMADYKLLPASWGKLNSHNAPSMSLLIVGACTQAFLIVPAVLGRRLRLRVLHVHRGHRHHLGLRSRLPGQVGRAEQERASQAAIGFVAVAFQVIGVLFNGWSFLLLTCVGYIPGFFIYVKARKDYGNAITMGEKVCMGVVSALGVLSLVLLAMGVISDLVDKRSKFHGHQDYRC